MKIDAIILVSACAFWGIVIGWAMWRMDFWLEGKKKFTTEDPSTGLRAGTESTEEEDRGVDGKHR